MVVLPKWFGFLPQPKNVVNLAGGSKLTIGAKV